MGAPNLTPTQLNDLVATTLRKLNRGKFTEIATDYQEFTALPRIMKQGVEVQDGGYGVQWDVMVTHSGSAENVGQGAQDNVNITDVMIQAQADWRFSTANWALLGPELAMNSGESKIVELIKTRETATMISLAVLMEANLWGPPVALSDTITPWGLNTWFPKSATEGFNGTVPSGYTTIGNINPTTYPRWAAWTAPYTVFSKDDGIRALRKASRKTGFKPPVDGIRTLNTGDKYGQYTNLAGIQTLEETLEGQNENLGNDIASKDGEVMFRRGPVSWVPYLDADTTNPFYGINWGTMKLIVLKGWWLKRTPVPIYPGQHTMSAHFVDIQHQWVCYDRRRNYVASTGTSYPA